MPRLLVRIRRPVMHKLIIAAAATAAFAAPAFAQPPAYPDPIEEGIERAIPPAEEVEAMAPTSTG
jgi:hypothetical protein